MRDKVQEILEEKIEKSLSNLKEGLNTVRAGRANPSLLDKVQVEYYGTPTPLKQLANVAVTDPRSLAVTPFDPKALKEIERAINAANVGINPINDGKIIRLSIPQVTEERRRELVKEVKGMGEESKVAIRNLRRTANEEVKKEEKGGDITEDDMKEDLEDIQKAVDNGIKKVEEICENKEKEIMEV